jgi:biotin operon repressor
MPTSLRREKTYGPGRAVPLDRNAKARIMVYARTWTAQHRQPGQHKGPLTRTFLEVLRDLLWGFHNAQSGRCFPSYDKIAEKAGCARSTVAAAISALEFAGILTWQHRITRIREKGRDLFGRIVNRSRIIRTSNAYRFFDPNPRAEIRQCSKSENRPGTQFQEVLRLSSTPATRPIEPLAVEKFADSPLGRALDRLGNAVEARLLGKGTGTPAMQP